MRRAILFLSLLLALSCRDMGRSDQQLKAEAVKVGFLGVIVNPTNSAQWLQGARLAEAEINAAGGVNGQPLQILVSADFPGSPYMDGAASLVAQGCVGLVGPPFSSLTINTFNQVSGPAGVPLVSYAATSPTVSTLSGAGDLVWRTAPSDALQGAVLAQKVWAQGVTNVGMIYPDDAYGMGLSSAFRTGYEALGGVILSSASFPAGKVSNFQSEVTQLLAGGVPKGILMVGIVGADSTGIAQEVVARNPSPFPLFFGGDATVSGNFLLEAPQQVLDVLYGTDLTVNLADPNFQKFSDALRAATGFQTEGASENRAYDAVYLTAYAMVRGGANTSQAIRQNLRAVSGPGGSVIGVDSWAQGAALLKAGGQINYTGASGRIDFDGRGDVTSATYRWWRVVGRTQITLEVLTAP